MPSLCTYDPSAAANASFVRLACLLEVLGEPLQPVATGYVPPAYSADANDSKRVAF